MVTALYVPFLITALLIELTPGPNMAWLALTSASKGRKSGFAAVAGIALGLALLGGASAFGLSELATGSPVVFNLLRYAGVAYLLWLAWETWSSGNETAETALDHSGLMDWFRHGLLLNLLNPKGGSFFHHRASGLYQRWRSRCFPDSSALVQLCRHRDRHPSCYRCFGRIGACMACARRSPTLDPADICGDDSAHRNLVFTQHSLNEVVPTLPVAC